MGKEGGKGKVRQFHSPKSGKLENFPPEGIPEFPLASANLRQESENLDAIRQEVLMELFLHSVILLPLDLAIRFLQVYTGPVTDERPSEVALRRIKRDAYSPVPSPNNTGGDSKRSG